MADVNVKKETIKNRTEIRKEKKVICQSLHGDAEIRNLRLVDGRC